MELVQFIELGVKPLEEAINYGIYIKELDKVFCGCCGGSFEVEDGEIEIIARVDVEGMKTPFSDDIKQILQDLGKI